MRQWIDGASRYVGLAESSHRIGYLIESEQFKEVISPTVYSQILDWFNYTIDPPKIKGFDILLREARRVSGKVILFGRYTVPVKQFLNLFDASVKISPFQLSSAETELIAKTSLTRWVLTSPAIRERILDITVNDLNSAFDKFGRAPAIYTDRLTASIIKVAIMRDQMNKILKNSGRITSQDFKEIDRFSSDMVDAIMAAISRSETPPVFRTEILKNLNMFMHATTAKLNFHIQDVWLQQNPKLEEKIPQAHWLGITLSVFALILAAYVEKLIDDLYFDKDLKEITKDTLFHLIGNVAIVGNVFYAFLLNKNYDPISYLNLINNFRNNLYLLGQSVKDETKKKYLEETIFSSLKLFGFPEQFKKTIQGLITVKKGSVEINNKTVPIDKFYDILVTILKGKYGSPAAKEAFKKLEEKLSPIQEKLIRSIQNKLDIEGKLRKKISF